MPSELEIISNIRRRARKGSGIIVGIGDDAAVLNVSPECELLACCDLSVEDVHFKTDWSPPHLIGHKAIAVNISDIAAMGGIPKYAMISIAVKGRTDEYIDALFEGLNALADRFGVSIVGGDTSASPGPLFIDVSLLGEVAKGRAVLRSGAKPGDLIFVTGSLGSSALGLNLLQLGHRLSGSTVDQPSSSSDNSAQFDPIQSARERAILRHLAPEPRAEFGRLLGQSGLATSMIDISDGLTTDLSHILEESRCGAVLQAESIPVSDSLLILASEMQIDDPLNVALNSGEEYELLFTAREACTAGIQEIAARANLRISKIGRILNEPEMLLDLSGALSILTPCGYQHDLS